jgi:molybdate transport system substrate-binding protein
VASNFAGAFGELESEFESETGHRLLPSFGSTGKLYAQIEHGAPFEVFLAADAERPRRLEQTGRTVSGTRFTYAVGRLVLWSARDDLVDPDGAVLESRNLGRLAMANPQTAPYGAAARQVLERLGLWSRLAPDVVRGENVAQAFQFVATGNAELGFVALSQLGTADAARQGSRWEVPGELYEPLEQQALMLQQGRGSAAAAAFLQFLRSPRARSIIERAGYRLPGG